MNHKIVLLGAGFISNFYAQTLCGYRGRDSIELVCDANPAAAKAFCEKWGVPRFVTTIEEAVIDPAVDTVVVGLPNFLHERAVLAAAKAGKHVLCTKPLGRTAEEAYRMLKAVEEAGVFAGYLEDLVYTPKSLKSLDAIKNGSLGKILWCRSRETHPGPHSDWFWKKEFSGGGAIVDMGCHCIEIARNFIGKDIRPLEVMCWADTQVHPIETEDHAIGLVRYANGAIGQFEVSWTFRGGMDLRDEVAGTEGTLWINHWLRTGFEMFTTGGKGGYVAEKAETDKGWLFPVGDEPGSLGYTEMFLDMFNSMDAGAQPMETFYDGYIINAIIDAAYLSAASKQWEPVVLKDWRGSEEGQEIKSLQEYDAQYFLIKKEVMPDGQTKLILKDKHSGEIIQKVISG